MVDWSDDLNEALASGDPRFMRAMLARVPKEVLQRAIPYLDHLARRSEKDGKLEDCLCYCEQLVQAMPDHVGRLADRARVLGKLGRCAESLRDAEQVIALAPQNVIGYRLQADACTVLGEKKRALAALREILRLEPRDEESRKRLHVLEDEMRKEAMLKQALDPETSAETLQIELPAPPQVVFDPALFADPAMPIELERFRIDGLRQHLWRYSGQLSPRNAIIRLEDPYWLTAWDTALATTAGLRVLFRGSELGVFALRALHHGATHALCVEAYPLDARIATGMVQKHFMARWQAQHGAAIHGWSEEERRASFEALTNCVDIVMADNQEASYDCNCLVFPHIDHSLLGTGIVRAVRQYRDAAGSASLLRVLPASATVFAIAIQWNYPGSTYQLEPMNRLRWSPYPQALELGPEFWCALTEPVQVGTIDFANFGATTWNSALPVTAEGRCDAILFWFELELGGARLSNMPGSDLQWLKPAVQYIDSIELHAEDTLELRVRVEETRLHFDTVPPIANQRSRGLPAWYVPMLGDTRRNEAYRSAIERALEKSPASLVLDIGAGCGLLSMTAAEAGAQCVVGCEINPAILRAGQEIVALNGLDEKIVLLEKDCRKLTVPEDLPRRAELAVFELFDCSLIGEGILHFLAYARAQLLTEHARYLPAEARIRAMLIEYRLDQIWDIDANLLNPFRASTSFINVDAAKLDYRTLSEPCDVFAFDFATAGPTPEEIELHLSAVAPGTVGAVLFWFELKLDENNWLSNDPQGNNLPHWKQGLQVLPELRVEAGATLPLLAKHDGSSLKFRWQPDVLPREALSSLPRWDPRWLALSSELEHQTQSLLQHCAQNPDEYAKVAEIAKRFAVDPATYDLAPDVAQRFVSMFFNG